MLLSTNLTISEIAYQTGFQWPQIFYQGFSAEFGVSPKEMRVRGEGNYLIITQPTALIFLKSKRQN